MLGPHFPEAMVTGSSSLQPHAPWPRPPAPSRPAGGVQAGLREQRGREEVWTGLLLWPQLFMTERTVGSGLPAWAWAHGHGHCSGDSDSPSV